jgi:hypothetical protein
MTVLLNTKKMSKLIRKITIGKDYKIDAMHYSVGQEVYGGHTICDIVEEKDKFSVYIRKNKDVMPWKDFNKNMAVSVEYNLEY